MKIAIFCGGPSSEFEVSLSSAKTISQNLDKKKHEIYFFLISKNLNCKLLIAEDNLTLDKVKTNSPLTKGLENLKKRKFFALLAGIHGEFGEDGRLQSLLDFYQIPYSGTGFKGSAIAMDKYVSMNLVKEKVNISIPKTIHLNYSEKEKLPDFSFPLVVKPNNLGSSVGVSVVDSSKELYKSLKNLKSKLKTTDVLLQEYLNDSIEISCGCLQKKDGSFVELPPIEIRPKKSTLFDYSSKYEIGGSDEITPPVSISQSLSKKISDITCQIHSILGLKTYSRSDFMIKNGKIYYLETNTLPGMTATSLLPQEANAIGISFPKLLDFIIENS